MSEDLKDLAYGIKFDIDDSGLEKVSEKGNIVDSILDKLSSAVEKFQNGLNGTGDSAKKMSDNLNSVSTEQMEKYNQQLEWADRKLDIIGEQYALAAKKAESLYEEYSKAAEMLGTQSDRAIKLKEELTNAQMKELKLEEATEKAGEQFQKQQELVNKVTNDLGKTSEAENKVADGAGKTTNEFKNMEGVTGRISSILGAFGIIGIGYSTINGIKNMTQAYMDFQQTMASTHAVLGDVSKKDMDNLSQAALNMSSKYGIASKDVASGEETLASAGLNAKEVMKELEPTLLLATAGNIKMDAATADVTSTIKNFGLKAGDATHVVDVFAKSAADTAAEMPDIATAMSYIAPIANSVGWSLEQTTAAIGELSNSGIKGSKAGTTLREIVSRLVYPTGKAADLIKQLGFSAIDPTTHKMKDMTKILGDLGDAMQSHGLKNSAEQNAALKLIFGQEAFTGVSALMKAPKQIDDLAKSLQHADGAGKKYADTMNDTAQGALNRFKQSFTNAFITNIDKTNLGKTLKDFLNTLTKHMPEISDTISNVLKGIMNLGSFISQNWSTIKPIILGVAGAFAAFKIINTVIGAVQGLSSAIAFFTSPLGMVIGAIAIAVGGLIYFYNTNKKFRDSVNKLGSVLGSLGSNILPNVMSVFNAWISSVKTYAGDVAQVATGIIEVFTGVLTFLSGVFTGNWSKAWEGIKGIFGGIFDEISGMVKGFIDTIGGIFNVVGSGISAVKSLISGTSSSKSANSAVSKGASGASSSAAKSLSRIPKLATGTDYAQGGITLVGEKGPELVEMPQGAKVTPNDQLHQALNQKATQSFSSITSEYSKQVEQMQPAFNTYGQNLNASLSTGITNTKQNVSGAVINTMNVSGNVLNNFAKSSYNYGTGIVSEISQGVTDSTNNLTSIVKTLTDKVVDAFKTGFGIHSPSKVMYQIGDFLMQGLVNGMSSKDVEGFITNQIGSMTSAAGGAVSGNVAGWLSMALAATGTSMDWLPGLEKLVQAESGGSPTEVNGQAVGGEHATGLLQTLPSTFAAYAVKGLGDILNPIANAAAAINYIKSRYGSVYNTPLFKGGPYMGYANGTRNASSGLHWVGERGPELMNFKGGEQVIPNHESESLFSRPLSSTNKSTHIENKPEINIVIQESKNPKNTAQEVKKVIDEYFKNLGIVLSVEP